MQNKPLLPADVRKAQKYTQRDFQREFPNEQACLDYVMEQRFPGGVTECAKCGVERKHYHVNGRTAYACDHCGNHIYPLAGTIFEKSTTPLRVWFHAIFQMGSTRCGISAAQIMRETGVTYKTAWRMFRQIRQLMNEDGEIQLEGSTVEMDETWYGGKPRGQSIPAGRGGRERHRAIIPKKHNIVGIVERTGLGRVVARIAPSVSAETVLPMLREFVLPKSIVYTDEGSWYRRIGEQEIGGKPAGYVHKRIHHASKVYVRGDVHTQTIEGFWSLIKRGIGGTHHCVSAKFLQDYLNEYCFRYNRRRIAQPMFKLILERVSEKAS